MCVYCEIPDSSKEAFYSEHPEVNRNENEAVRMQINIIGDVKCGKTSLIEAYGAERFSPITSLSSYACYKLNNFDNKRAEIVLYDIIGLDSFDDPRRRTILYTYSEIAILCYSVDSQESFSNISSQWYPELNASPRKNLVILVGLKKDLRGNYKKHTDSNGESEWVTYGQGIALAKSIGAVDFIECSSLTGEGVNEVFKVAMKKIFRKYEKEAKGRFWRHLCCFN